MKVLVATLCLLCTGVSYGQQVFVANSGEPILVDRDRGNEITVILKPAVPVVQVSCPAGGCPNTTAVVVSTPVVRSYHRTTIVRGRRYARARVGYGYHRARVYSRVW